MTNLHSLSPSSCISEENSSIGERQSRVWKTDNVVDGCMVKLGLQRSAIGSERAAHSFSLWNPMEHGSGGRCDLSLHSENGLFSSSFSELYNRKLTLPLNSALCGHSVDTVASHYEEEEPLESLEEIEAQTIGNLLPDDDDLFSGAADGIEQTAHSSGGDEMEDLDFFCSIGGMDLGDDSSPSGPRNSSFSGRFNNSQLKTSYVSALSKHPCSQNPSRTLYVRNLNIDIDGPELQTLFEQYGNIRKLYTSGKNRGFVMVSYYDIRAAKKAMNELRNKPIGFEKLDVHYSISKENASGTDVSRGRLVVFILDSSLSNDELHQIFGVYGEVKEIREAPDRSNCRSVEFHDIRAAEAALHGLNQSDIAGNRIKLGPGHAAAVRCSLTQQLPPDSTQGDSSLYVQQNTLSTSAATGVSGSFLLGPITSTCLNTRRGGVSCAGMQGPAGCLGNVLNHGISSSVPSGLPSLGRVESAGFPSGLPDPGNSFNQTKHISGVLPLHPRSLPEYHDRLINAAACNPSLPQETFEIPHLGRISTNGHSLEMGYGFDSSGDGSCSLCGHHYTWSNSNHPHAPTSVWPNSPVFSNGLRATTPPSGLHRLARTPSHMLIPVISMNARTGSAPAMSPLWERRNSYLLGSPEASSFHNGSLGNVRLSDSPLCNVNCASQDTFSCIGENCMDMSAIARNGGLHSHYQRIMAYDKRAQTNPVAKSFEPLNEGPRNHRSESSSQVDNRKQYELDIDRILRGEDARTTLMIKNIPNKYTSKMLMTAIDERHRGTYDFIYLPIDFKNKCNVGYAFINMIDPSHIVPLYETFNGKKWAKFNSEKVASLAYARIQGKAALVAHFQNSSLMNEDKRCRPILFHTNGPNAADQVPLPMGVNVRSRSGKPKNGSSCSEDDHRGGAHTIAG